MKRRKNRIDTTREGFKHVGVNLTEQQYEDLCFLNMAIISSRKKTPVFNMMVLLKYLGLLPSEMIDKESGEDSDNNPNEDFKESFQRKFGRFKD